MDHYRLLGTLSGPCEGAKHVSEILRCASHSIQKDTRELFVQVEERGERMFFSQRKLKDHFRGKNNDILDAVFCCECQPCKAQRGDAFDSLTRCQRKIKENNAWLLVPIMIYMGKLHFIHPWLRTVTQDHVIAGKRTLRQIECKDVVEFNNLFGSHTEIELEKSLFQSAYDRVWYMFNPVRLEIDAEGWIQYQDLPDRARFPYENEDKVKLPQGQSSKVVYAEIPEEYVEASVQQRMNTYRDSFYKISDNKMFRIVRKVLKISADRNEGMQKETLTMLAAQNDHESAENIITLLGLYTWRGNIHYVFPFVKENLADLLSRPFPRRERSNGGLCLPEIWLWKELVGVAKALKHIHKEIGNPFPRDTGKVLAFHFDLKPENILVKSNPEPGLRRLQITDFGRSQIRLVDEGDDTSSYLYPGDLKYMAPEAWIKSYDTPQGNDTDHTMVLQNYDVWSLACIMLEVLVYLIAEHSLEGDGPKSLKKFDEERRKENPPVGFFTYQGMKMSVAQKVQTLPSLSAVPNVQDDTHRQYIQGLVGLLMEMFKFDKSDRADSEEVVNLLHKASKQYRRSMNRTHALPWKIMRAFPKQQRGFKEIGWYNQDKTVSFLEMYVESARLSRLAPSNRPAGKTFRFKNSISSPRRRNVIEIADSSSCTGRSG